MPFEGAIAHFPMRDLLFSSEIVANNIWKKKECNMLLKQQCKQRRSDIDNNTSNNNNNDNANDDKHNDGSSEHCMQVRVHK